MNINGVECDVHWIYFNDEKARLLVPRKVKDLPFPAFAVSCFAEKSSNYEMDALDASLWITLYYFRCYRHLLYKRKFDLSSLSSPFYPTLRKLCKRTKIKPTGDPILDSVETLIQLGSPDESRSLDEIMPRAIYKHPERIPLESLDEEIDTLADRGVENFEKALSQKIREADEPLEKILREVRERYLTLVLFLTERATFDILHQGGEAVYEMIKEKLSSTERVLFKLYCLKNPKYLNRIVCFDASPIVPSFLQMMEKIYRGAGVKKASLLLTPELVDRLWRSYLSFYPVWLLYVRDDEEDKGREGRKEVPYWSWSAAYVKEQPEHMMDPLVMALLKSGYPYDEESQKEPSKPRRKRKRKQRRVETFLSRLQREVVGLEAEGISNNDIAQIIGQTPSSVSKIRKRTSELLGKSWERGAYKPFLKQTHVEMRRLYMDLPSQKRPLFQNLYLATMRRLIQRISKNTGRSPEVLEKDLIPPFLAGSSPVC